jgi:hypothetical protein
MKIHNCEYCGDDLGCEIEKWPGEPITCGKRECERWAREEALAERDEAHDRLDRDMGW